MSALDLSPTLAARLQAMSPAKRALFEQALHTFAEAEKISPSGNDDAILRWNRCVRLLQNPTYVWDVWEHERASFDTEDAPPT